MQPVYLIIVNNKLDTCMGILKYDIQKDEIGFTICSLIITAIAALKSSHFSPNVYILLIRFSVHLLKENKILHLKT